MSLLTDTDLEPLLSDNRQEPDNDKLVLSPYDEKGLTPVGYDLRVGKTYTASDMGQVRKDLKEGEKITLQPGTTALISTLEYVRMPKNKTITGLIESKVSQVSKGLSHISTTVDPDWRGHLLIAIHNHAIEAIELSYGDTFCTIVFIRNVSPATRDCDKQPDRLDIFLDKFRDRSVKAQKTRKYKDLIPPAIVAGATIGGYFAFGPTPGFAATVAAGVAISQFVERRYLR
jgi:deoxycytidine triphosphate deaminase